MYRSGVVRNLLHPFRATSGCKTGSDRTMRRRALSLSLIAVIATALLLSASAFGARAGFNLPTKRLEGAYKFALQERRFNSDGCYDDPGKLAKILTKRTGRKVGVARSTNSLRNLNRVYVLKAGTSCDRLRMALRAVGGIYILDSTKGTVRIQGRKGRATPGLSRTLGNLSLATREFKLNKPDTAPRLEVLCPRGTYPVGGGMSQNPDVGPDGEGVYPHSYERLGAQLGFHISAVVLDPGGGRTTTRNVTVQVLCGRGVIPATPTPHKTVWVRSGQTKTVTAHCPKGQFLVGGGFQRTNFRGDGGNYVTESRAAGPKAWTVTGSAYSAYGPPGQGELTAIAYCARMKRPKLTEVVSSPVPVGDHGSATATTPDCPAGKRLITGGFSSTSRDGFFYDGRLNQNGTWSASEYGFFGPIAGLTAYGYCWPAR
jgi:hypothetical protein